MRVVVVGGGVAGASCVEELVNGREDDDRLKVTLVAPGGRGKVIRGEEQLSESVISFQVQEENFHAGKLATQIEIVDGVAVGVDAQKKLLFVEGESKEYRARTIPFDKLCIATGAIPKSPVDALHGRGFLTFIRDTESVASFIGRLRGARRVLVVGNGGIAMELVYSLMEHEVVWSVRHDIIGDAFFDRDAAKFLLGVLGAKDRRGDSMKQDVTNQEEGHAKQNVTESPSSSRDPYGYAVGPNWLQSVRCAGRTGEKEKPPPLRIIFDSEITSVVAGRSDASDPGGYKLCATMSSGDKVEADVIVCAVGVMPNTAWLSDCPEIALDEDGGIVAGRDLSTSCASVYAVGDCCTQNGWTANEPSWWFQMRIWTQARLTGMLAARCMLGTANGEGIGFNTELFTHATSFFGLKVVLIGRYNGQELAKEPDSDFVSYTRSSEEGAEKPEFIRFLLLRGRLVGAVLIGETGLEETAENLIMDQLDLSAIGPELLNPDVDIEDYFD